MYPWNLAIFRIYAQFWWNPSGPPETLCCPGQTILSGGSQCTLRWILTPKGGGGEAAAPFWSKSAEASGLKACRVAPSQRSTSSLLTQGEVYLSPFPLGPSGSAPQTFASGPPPPYFCYTSLPILTFFSCFGFENYANHQLLLYVLAKTLTFDFAIIHHCKHNIKNMPDTETQKH